MKWILTSAYAAVIVLIICLADRKETAFVFNWIRANPGMDKVCHFLLIGGFAFVANYALGCRELRIGRASLLVGSLVVGVLTVAEEISQVFIPSRTFDLVDLACDILGIWLIGSLARRGVKQDAGLSIDGRH